MANFEFFSARSGIDYIFCLDLYLDAAYSNFLNAYFFYEDSIPGIMYKEVNNQDPYFWLRIDLNDPSAKIGKLIRTAVQGRLILINNRENILAAEVQRNGGIGREFVCQILPEGIEDFLVTGRQDNLLLTLTSTGCIEAARLNASHFKAEPYLSEKLWMFREREESASSLTVCPRNSLLTVQVRQRGSRMLCSKLLIYEICKKTEMISFKAMLDLRPQRLRRFSCLASCYFEGQMVLCGLAGNLLFLFGYHPDLGVFREVSRARKELDIGKVVRVVGAEGEIMFNDEFGSLVKVLFKRGGERSSARAGKEGMRKKGGPVRLRGGGEGVMDSGIAGKDAIDFSGGNFSTPSFEG